MSLSQIIQTKEDLRKLSAQNIQLIIQTNEQLQLEIVDCNDLTIIFEGFQQYDHYISIINSLNNLQLHSLTWKSGVNNFFSDNDAEILAQFIETQQNITTLDISIDLGNTITSVGTKSILNAIKKLHLKKLTLSFDDETKLNLEDFSLQEGLQTLQLSFGSEVFNNNSWQLYKNTNVTSLQSLQLTIYPYNNLDVSFNNFLNWISLQTKLEYLNLSFSDFTNIKEEIICQLGVTLNKLKNLKELILFIGDTKQLTQKAFDELVGSFTNIEIINLKLGNNHHINNYNAFYKGIKQVKKLTLNAGCGFQIVSKQLFEENNFQILDISLNQDSSIQVGSFHKINEKLKNIEKISIKFIDSKDCSDTELIELIGELEGINDVLVQAGVKQVRKIKKALSISLNLVGSLKILFQQINLNQIEYLKLQIKTTSLNQEQVDQIYKQITQSDLKIFVLKIKKLINFSIHQITELFSQSVSKKKWKYFSIEIISKCIFQIYGKMQTYHQVNIQICSGMKLGSQGLNQLEKAIKSVNITKIRLTILNDNQLGVNELKSIAAALINSSNLQNFVCQIVDTNPQVALAINELQQTVNQYIKEKSKLYNTYCNVLQKEFNNNQDQISIEMLTCLSDYLIEEVVLPVPTTTQYQNHQQFVMSSAWNPQFIIDIFSQ